MRNQPNYTVQGAGVFIENVDVNSNHQNEDVSPYITITHCYSYKNRMTWLVSLRSTSQKIRKSKCRRASLHVPSSKWLVLQITDPCSHAWNNAYIPMHARTQSTGTQRACTSTWKLYAVTHRNTYTQLKKCLLHDHLLSLSPQHWTPWGVCAATRGQPSIHASHRITARCEPVPYTPGPNPKKNKLIN